MRAAGVAPCAMAAVDVALWDLRAKQGGLPLYRLLGLGRRAVPTSLTVGINPPEVVRERVPLLLAQGARALKIKLGAPEGLDADKAMFAAVLEAAAGSGAVLRVDANGGWSLEEARHMMAWLAERDVEYVEQPLVRGAEDQLPALFASRSLPIFVDESCRMSGDIPGFAHAVDGVNLKLMKCGGLTEALRIVATARAHGLATMIGCMGESSISIAAGAALSELFDYIDLDSHLNLAPDPATGAPLEGGRVPPGERPGHGGRLHDA
jgi:muconate cycloisomerase